MKIVNRVLIILFLTSTLTTNLQAQGKLFLLGGGGGESAGGWTDAPYAWAVEQSNNKRVAVIDYNEQDDFYVNRFVASGAEGGTVFLISSNAIANQQSTYEELIEHDIFFFAGGDQYQYYSLFKNSLVHQAIEDKFAEGGVIGGTSAGMAILSEVMFTAENGTVYPDECLADPFNQYVTLANDFLQIYPNFIFDTHFVERGRLPRLTTFMAHWETLINEPINGIGVDDRTALCIDANNIGHAFGIGAVTILPSFDFNIDNNQLESPPMEVIHLVYGDSIDLNTFETFGLNEASTPDDVGETHQSGVLLGGGATVADNGFMISHLLDEMVNHEETLLIFAGNNQTEANNLKNTLENGGMSNVFIVQASEINANDMVLAAQIEQCKQFGFVGNSDYTVFMDFWNGAVGATLQSRIVDLAFDPSAIFAFLGEDVRWAGNTFVDNLTTEPYAAYYGELAFENGLNILPETIVIGDTYDTSSSDFYENKTAALPYAMLQNSTNFGLWLNEGNFVQRYKDENSGEVYFQAFGDIPVLLLENEGANYNFTQETFGTANYTRTAVGFEGMQLHFMDNDQPVLLSGEATNITENATFSPRFSLQISPNPVENQLWMETNLSYFTYFLIHLNGQLIQQGQVNKNKTQIDITNLASGMYLLQVTHPTKGMQLQKIIKY
ncbi:MAG: T9SS type A sorting domain-containing protein [Chitinophagales bacterium]